MCKTLFVRETETGFRTMFNGNTKYLSGKIVGATASAIAKTILIQQGFLNWHVISARVDNDPKTGELELRAECFQ